MARVGIDIVVKQEKLWQCADAFSQPKLETFDVPKIAILNVFTGMGNDILEAILEPPLQDLILKTYGAGNMINDLNIHATLKKANDRSVVIVNYAVFVW